MRTVNFLLPALVAAPLASASASTIHEFLAQGKFCSATALAVSRACTNQTADDYWIGIGICINESDSRDRAECNADVKDSFDEATKECAAQLKARDALCKQVGEGRYDPEFEETDFDTDFRNLTNPNPLFPACDRQSLGIPQRRGNGRRADTEPDQADRRRDLHRRARRRFPKIMSTKEPTTGSRKRRTAPSGIAARKPRRSRPSKATA